MVSNPIALNLPPAKFVCFPKRMTNERDALLRDLHLPAAACDKVPIGSLSDLPSQNAAVVEQQNGSLAVDEWTGCVSGVVVSAHSCARNWCFTPLCGRSS